MLKPTYINVHSNGSDTSDCKFGAWQMWQPVRLAVYVILGIFWSFSLKAHNCYPAYHIGTDFSDLTIPVLRKILFMKTFYDVVNSINFYSKEARASIVLDIEWTEFVLQNCEKMQNYRFIEGKVEQLLFEVCMIKNRHTGILLFSSDLMYKNTDKKYI